jgi:hypothetical protein
MDPLVRLKPISETDKLLFDQWGRPELIRERLFSIAYSLRFAFISLHRPLEVVDPDHRIRYHTVMVFWIGEGKRSAQVLVYEKDRNLRTRKRVGGAA